MITLIQKRGKTSSVRVLRIYLITLWDWQSWRKCGRPRGKELGCFSLGSWLVSKKESGGSHGPSFSRGVSAHACFSRLHRVRSTAIIACFLYSFAASSTPSCGGGALLCFLRGVCTPNTQHHFDTVRVKRRRLLVCWVSFFRRKHIWQLNNVNKIFYHFMTVVHIGGSINFDRADNKSGCI